MTGWCHKILEGCLLFCSFEILSSIDIGSSRFHLEAYQSGLNPQCSKSTPSSFLRHFLHLCQLAYLFTSPFPRIREYPTFSASTTILCIASKWLFFVIYYLLRLIKSQKGRWRASRACSKEIPSGLQCWERILFLDCIVMIYLYAILPVCVGYPLLS